MATVIRTPLLGAVALLLTVVAPPPAHGQTRFGVTELMDQAPGPMAEDGAGSVFLGVGAALWSTDGTADGTLLASTFDRVVFDIVAPQGTADVPSSGVVVRVDREDDAWELWGSDGTAAGTTMLAAEVQGVATALGGHVLFWTAQADGVALRRASTSGEVEELATFAAPDPGAPAGPSPVVVAGDHGYFVQLDHDATHGEAESLWSVDPAGQVERVAVYDRGSVTLPEALATSDHLVYAARPLEAAGVADPTPTLFSARGGVSVAVYEPDGADEAVQGIVADVGGLTLFWAGAEGDLWKTDGTLVGTELLTSNTTVPAVLAAEFPGVQLDGWRYWPDTKSLWRTDGATFGSFYNPKGAISDKVGGSGVWASEEAVWWYALQTGAAPELYESDGTFDGTRRALSTAELAMLEGELIVRFAAGGVLYATLDGALIAIGDTGETHPCPDPVLDVGEDLEVDLGEAFTLSAEACHPGGATLVIGWGIAGDAPGEAELSAQTGGTVEVTVDTPGDYRFIAATDGPGVHGLTDEVIVTVIGEVVEPGPDGDGGGGATDAAPTSAGGGCLGAGGAGPWGLLGLWLLLAAATRSRVTRLGGRAR